MTTKSEISAWFDEGVQEQATHMIIVCDTSTYVSYPIFTKGVKETLSEFACYDGKYMQRVIEVYDLRKDKNAQLSVERVFNLPVPGDAGDK